MSIENLWGPAGIFEENENGDALIPNSYWRPSWRRLLDKIPPGAIGPWGDGQGRFAYCNNCSLDDEAPCRYSSIEEWHAKVAAFLDEGRNPCYLVDPRE